MPLLQGITSDEPMLCILCNCLMSEHVSSGNGMLYCPTETDPQDFDEYFECMTALQSQLGELLVHIEGCNEHHALLMEDRGDASMFHPRDPGC